MAAALPSEYVGRPGDAVVGDPTATCWGMGFPVLGLLVAVLGLSGALVRCHHGPFALVSAPWRVRAWASIQADAALTALLCARTGCRCAIHRWSCDGARPRLRHARRGP